MTVISELQKVFFYDIPLAMLLAVIIEIIIGIAIDISGKFGIHHITTEIILILIPIVILYAYYLIYKKNPVHEIYQFGSQIVESPKKLLRFTYLGHICVIIIIILLIILSLPPQIFEITSPMNNSSVGDSITIYGQGGIENSIITVSVIDDGNKEWLQDGTIIIPQDGRWIFKGCIIGRNGEDYDKNFTIYAEMLINGKKFMTHPVTVIKKRS